MRFEKEKSIYNCVFTILMPKIESHLALIFVYSYYIVKLEWFIVDNCMRLQCLDGCRLKIDKYPPFADNATGGGRKNDITSKWKNVLQKISFPSTLVFIPPLTSKLKKFLSLPFSTGLKSKYQWIR